MNTLQPSMTYLVFLRYHSIRIFLARLNSWLLSGEILFKTFSKNLHINPPRVLSFWYNLNSRLTFPTNRVRPDEMRQIWTTWVFPSLHLENDSHILRSLPRITYTNSGFLVRFKKILSYWLDQSFWSGERSPVNFSNRWQKPQHMRVISQMKRRTIHCLCK